MSIANDIRRAAVANSFVREWGFSAELCILEAFLEYGDGPLVWAISEKTHGSIEFRTYALFVAEALDGGNT